MNRSDAEQLWGTELAELPYAGHPGLQYPVHPTTFSELLSELPHWNERTFLVQGDRRITFAAFLGAVGAAGRHLDELRVQRGDHVLLLAYNSPDWVLALWALWLRGAIPVLGNRWWSAGEIGHALDLLAPCCVITDAADLPQTVSVPVHPIADFGPLLSTESANTTLPAERIIDEDAVALVLFTSGSSGLPKGVALSRRSMISNQHNLLLRGKRLPRQQAENAPQATSLLCTPLFHIGGVTNLLTQLLTGGKIVMTKGRFDPKEVLDLIQAERVNSFGGVPTMASRVLEHPDFETYDLSSLQSWPLGGAKVSQALLERMSRKLPQLSERGLGNTYGMTESGGFLTGAGNRDMVRHPGTVGRPYPVVELKIDNPDDRGVGEILVRSPTVMLGYVGIDDGTVDPAGWLHTGDLGHLNDEGYLFIDGRSKDIIIRGGENIACPHVEAALASHPDVLEVAAIGLPHPDLGEEVAAVVVHRKGGPVPTEDELVRHLRGVVAYFAIPTRWQIRDEPLPTLAGEKTDKKSLVAEFPPQRG